MNKHIKILSINVNDKAELLSSAHQSAISAYKKLPMSSKNIFLTLNGFEGDSVVNTKYHGGNDKAICCYNSNRFVYWKKTLEIELAKGAFGENLTLSGYAGLEENVYIGDKYQLGESIVQVSEPRGPCYMIGIRHNLKKFPLLCQETGYTGFYLRTLQEGKVSNTDSLIHLSSHPEKVSVMDVNQIRYHDIKNKLALERLVNLTELTQEWRDRFMIMLHKL